MGTIVSIGRVFVAIALVAFGIQQALFGDFVAGRARAWPTDVPGRMVWALSSGALFVLTGGAIAWAAKMSSQHTARRLAIVTGATIFGWAFVRQVPIALADSSFGGAWTALGKALALSGGALAVAGTLTDAPRTRRVLIQTGRTGLGLFMIAAGIQHFLFAPFVKTFVPAWIPGSLFWTYFAGVALVAGGGGLILSPTAPAAGLTSGVMVFIWFLILHIPRAMSASAAQSRNEWIAVFEALAVSGIALMTATGDRRVTFTPSSSTVSPSRP